MILTQPQPNLATPRNQPQAALANYTTLARSMQPILTTPVLQDRSQPNRRLGIPPKGSDLVRESPSQNGRNIQLKDL